MIRLRLCALAVAALAGLPLGAEPRDEPEEKVFAEPKPDQALVYVIRPHGPGLGDKVGSFIYADQTVLAHLKGNTYSFAYLPPGSYLVWDYLARRLDLVPGQVYYVLCGPFHGGISLLGEEEGKQLLQTVKRYRPLDPEHAAEGQEKAAKQFPKVKANVEKHKRGAEVPVVPAPSPPAQTDGLLRVPAYSPVKVELMETVSSRLSVAGETIWFRVAEDASVEGGVWLRAGTAVKGVVVEAGHSGGGGKAGSLEVRVPALPGAGGTALPAVGQMVSVGKSKAGQASLGFAVGGLLGSALVKGRETYHVAGSEFTVWTRDEAWAEPAGDAVSAPKPEPDTPAPVTVKPVQPLRFDPGTRGAPAPVALLVETDREIKQLALMKVGDWTIPDPPKAVRVERREGQWMATFPGWDLLQYLRPSSTPIAMRFEATPAEGAPFIAEASVPWTPEP